MDLVDTKAEMLWDSLCPDSWGAALSSYYDVVSAAKNKDGKTAKATKYGMFKELDLYWRCKLPKELKKQGYITHSQLMKAAVYNTHTLFQTRSLFIAPTNL